MLLRITLWIRFFQKKIREAYFQPRTTDSAVMTTVLEELLIIANYFGKLTLSTRLFKLLVLKQEPCKEGCQILMVSYEIIRLRTLKLHMFQKI